MDRSQLDGLVVFLAVAEARGFRAAAKRLGVTPSAVSQAVQTLERRVGVPLFQRTTRSVGLSEAGECLLAHARPALEMFSSGLEAASHLGDAVSGLLRITVPRASLTLFLNRVLPDFLQEHPNLGVEMVGEDEIVDIVENGYDAGVCFGNVVQADMVATWLTRPERLLVVGSAAYFEAYGKPKHPSELQDFRCILFRRPDRVVNLWHFMIEGTRTSVRVAGPLILNDVNACIHGAVRGAGLFLAAESVVNAHIASGKLVSVLDGYAEQVPGLTLYYPSRRQSLPKLRAFREFAVERIRADLHHDAFHPMSL